MSSRQAWAAMMSFISSVTTSPSQPSKFFSAMKTLTRSQSRCFSEVFNIRQ